MGRRGEKEMQGTAEENGYGTLLRGTPQGELKWGEKEPRRKGEPL
jgi:hypothetical protein